MDRNDFLNTKAEEKYIKIVDFCETALSTSDAEIIKNEIEKNVEKYEKIILDFENIIFFATPFFNLAIGHFVTKLTPKVFEEKIKCINLTELGKETYNYSYNNACSLYKKSLENIDIEKNNSIVDENIENS